jgi:sugar/nucleoside kinase (ribokinase family)
VTATQYAAATGGAPANVAAGLTKLGRHARLIATVGDDAFGRKIQHDLQTIGVDCALRTDPDHFTTLAFVKQGVEGDRDFEFNAGAHDYLLPDQINPTDVNQALALHYGSISLRTGVSREATMKAIQLAKEAGVACSCDPNWRPSLWADKEAGKAAMLDAISHADILKISDVDLECIVPDESDYAVALEKAGFKGRMAAVTLGKDGSWYKAGDRSGRVASPTVQVVETTGAGDAFTAALLDGLINCQMDPNCLNDEDLRRLVQRACAAGALTATGYGAIPSLPDTKSIDAMLRMVSMGEKTASNHTALAS